jgi:hypothetical protein
MASATARTLASTIHHYRSISMLGSVPSGPPKRNLLLRLARRKTRNRQVSGVGLTRPDAPTGFLLRRRRRCGSGWGCSLNSGRLCSRLIRLYGVALLKGYSLKENESDTATSEHQHCQNANYYQDCHSSAVTISVVVAHASQFGDGQRRLQPAGRDAAAAAVAASQCRSPPAIRRPAPRL